MLQLHCSGSPYEVKKAPLQTKTIKLTNNAKKIGYKHGQEAKDQVSRTMTFYASLFATTAKISWPRVQEIALEFLPVIRKKWPAYLEEMRGLPPLPPSLP